jgi:hypothetical protein
MSATLLDPIEQVILPPVRSVADFQVRRALPTMRRRMVGPFIFFDQLGPVVFREGQGIDTPPHPHIGLATLTYLIEGEIVHRDSAGNVQTIRAGEVNWMTAGRGIAHSERTGPEARARGGSMFGQQIWIALPTSHEETDPSFSHHPADTLPKIEGEGASATLIAGTAFGRRSPVVTYSEMMYADVTLEAGAQLKLGAEHEQRAIYGVSGAIEVSGQEGAFTDTQLVIFKPGAEIVLRAPERARFMLLGGAPLPEKRHIYWNFVSSSPERIEQAKADWRERRFADIPGETDFVPLPEERPRAEK